MLVFSLLKCGVSFEDFLKIIFWWENNLSSPTLKEQEASEFKESHYVLKEKPLSTLNAYFYILSVFVGWMGGIEDSHIR